MDSNIRPKTPIERAVEQRRQQTADSEQAFIQAMADALGEIGYTRDTTPDQIGHDDIRLAIGRGLKALVIAGDWSFLGEFLSEGGKDSDRAIFMALSDFMIAPSVATANNAANVLARTARWYGESWLQRALDMLDSASEIARDRQVDEQIDERKSA